VNEPLSSKDLLADLVEEEMQQALRDGEEDSEHRASLATRSRLEIERLQRAVTSAMDLLSNGDTEGGARVLRECFWGTAPEPAHEQRPLSLNGHQLLAVVQFCGGDFDTDLSIGYFPERPNPEGQIPLPAGLYVWCTEYPDEGCWYLNEEPVGLFQCPHGVPDKTTKPCMICLDKIIRGESTTQPPSADEAELPLGARVRNIWNDKTGEVVAIDTRYEIQGDDGKHFFAQHRDLERLGITKESAP
jgi:hypothetical protein